MRGRMWLLSVSLVTLLAFSSLTDWLRSWFVSSTTTTTTLSADEPPIRVRK